MMNEHAVVIAGGGPTGLVLAAELALARVDVVIVERRETQELTGARARGLHARTIEELDQRGVVERFLSQGQTMHTAGFAFNPLDMKDCPSRHNYVLALLQRHVERILAEWVTELGVPILRGRDVVDFTDDTAHIDVQLSDRTSLRAHWLVGCDGGRSFVRKKAGIDFPGWDPTVSYLIAEAEMTEEPPWGVRRGLRGVNAIGKADDGKRAGIVLGETEVKHGDTPAIDELRAALVAVYGTDFGIHDVTWLSRFTDATRQAATYRKGHVLLAGDAAHIHSPAGGQGLNLGAQDAVNLGWKLAQVVRGQSSDALLDTYQAERHPVAAHALELTMAQTVLSRGDERTQALAKNVSAMLRMDEPRRTYAAIMSGLDVRYDLGDGHPLLGRRMPDLELTTTHGALRTFSLLHEARPVLLAFGGTLDIAPWLDRVKLVEARHHGPWELPIVGPVAAPSAVLVRPDGYVAWVGDGSDAGLHEALEKWFGPPHASTAIS